MNPTWWTRLYDSVANVFRRDPPHLRGRVPVECGEGIVRVRCADTDDPDGRCSVHGAFCPAVRNREMPAPPDPMGHAFLKSAPPSALDRAVQKAQAACSRRERVVSVTPEEYEAARRMESTAWRFVPALGDTLTLYGVRLEVLTPEDIERGRCKPSPADNARRYSQEESTW